MRINPHGQSTCDIACCTRIEGVSVSIGHQVVLDNINLHMHCGETTAIIGPNGAGKSTLIKAILGEIPHDGSIRFTNRENRTPVSPIIGYVPQMPRFDAQYPATVLDLFVACTSKFPVWLPCPQKLRAEVTACLRAVGMEEQIDRRVGVLSGGELQRVLLALALRPRPNLLLLDEPSSGIDVRGIERYYRTVEDVKEKGDLSVILVSHDPDLIRRYADRVILLCRRVVRAGTPDEVLDSPEYRALLGQEG